jgi:hypothetical protein
MRFEVLTAASMKMTVFWVLAPCSLTEVYRRFRGRAANWRFRGAFCLMISAISKPRGLPIALMMEAASTSETSVNLNRTTRRNNPKDGHLHPWVLFVLCTTRHSFLTSRSVYPLAVILMFYLPICFRAISGFYVWILYAVSTTLRGMQNDTHAPCIMIEWYVSLEML